MWLCDHHQLTMGLLHRHRQLCFPQHLPEQHRSACQPSQMQCLSVILLCHSASTDISLWQGQVWWAWHRDVRNRGSTAAHAHQIDSPCSILSSHDCTVAVCPISLSHAPQCLKTFLQLFKVLFKFLNTSFFALFSRYQQACYPLLGQ